MRQGSAGHSRGVSFPKSTNKHKELVHPAFLAAGAAFANADVVLHNLTFAEANVLNATTSDMAFSNAVKDTSDKTLYIADATGVYSGPALTKENVTLLVTSFGAYKGNQVETINALKLDSGVSISSTAGGNIAGAGDVKFNSSAKINLTGSDGFLDVDCDTRGAITVGGLSGDSAVYLNSAGLLTLAANDTLSNDVDIYAIVSGDAGSRTLVSGIADGWSGNVYVSTTGVAGSYTLAEDFTVSGGTLSVSTIPEPSAFGLLAGLGALALVASRRRRK